MKVIFLDIDGVLNSLRSMVARAGQVAEHPSTAIPRIRRIAAEQAPMLDPVAIGLLNKLTDADPTVKLVISSTHRMFAFDEGKLDPVALADYMRLLGVTGEVIDATPLLGATRGQEISMWLAVSAPLALTRIIIIDDDSDMLPEQMPRFVHCNSAVGFSFENFKQAAGLLGITDAQLFDGGR